jgi:hypothetical protein
MQKAQDLEISTACNIRELLEGVLNNLAVTFTSL